MELVKPAQLKPYHDVIEMLKLLISDIEEGKYGNNPRAALALEDQETEEGYIFGYGQNSEKEDCVYLFNKGTKYLLG